MNPVHNIDYKKAFTINNSICFEFHSMYLYLACSEFFFVKRHYQVTLIYLFRLMQYSVQNIFFTFSSHEIIFQLYIFGLSIHDINITSPIRRDTFFFLVS